MASRNQICLTILFSFVALLALSSSVNSSPCLKSRAIQNLGCNCQLNVLFRKEYELALEYLNASSHMMSDRVAQYGFGKMFNKFWKDQLESANTMRKYMLQRGARIFMPSMLFFNDQYFDHFINEEKTVRKFLDLEKGLNQILLENLYPCLTGSDASGEVKCLKTFGEIYGHKCPNSYMNMTMSAKIESFADPATADFLDSTFVSGKVERIKFLADLLSRVERQYVKTSPAKKTEQVGKKSKRDMRHADESLDQLAMFIIDKELQQQFN